MKYTFPADYGDDAALVPIDITLVPLICGALQKFLDRGVWQTYADYEQGYNAFTELMANMTNSALRELIEGQKRIYRLLDTSLNGTQYEASTPDPVTGEVFVTPNIPYVPPASTDAQNAMRAHIGRLWQLAENHSNGRSYSAGSGIDGSPALTAAMSLQARLAALQGEINEGWFGIGGENATVADIVNALRVGSNSDTERITQALDDILGGTGLDDASQAANIFNTVRGLFTDTAEITAEGGVLATLIASSLASAAFAGMLSGQIDRLIAALDGGGLVAATPPPAGSVLGQLETIKVQLQ